MLNKNSNETKLDSIKTSAVVDIARTLLLS